MNIKTSVLAMTAGLALAATQAQAVTINFDTLAAGTVLSNQYAAMGAVFSANAFIGPGTSTSGMNWASNTDLTVVSSTGTDISTLGGPSLVSGNILGSFAGWTAENGDPSFSIAFSTAITSFGATFAGVDTPSDVRVFAYNGSSLLGSVSGSGVAGQFALGWAAPSITRVVITPGSYNDWVAVDNIVFAPVPEPTTFALMALGLGLTGMLKRRPRA